MIRILAVNKKGNKIVDYLCTDGKKQVHLNKEELYNYYKASKVENIKSAQVYNGNIIIRGDFKVINDTQAANIPSSGITNKNSTVKVSKPAQQKTSTVNEAAKQISKTKTKQVANNDKYSDVADAMHELQYAIMDLGDSWEATMYDTQVWSPNSEAIINKFEESNRTDEDIEKAIKSIYIDIINNNVAGFGEWIDLLVNEDNLREAIEHGIVVENVTSINKSKIYTALATILKNLKDRKICGKQAKELANFMRELKGKSVASTYIGFAIGHRYFEYLDNQIFGTISNDVYTVGSVISSSDKERKRVYKGATYCLAKDINSCDAPRASIAAFFINSDIPGKVDIKFCLEYKKYVGSSCINIAGHDNPMNLEPMTVDRNDDLDKLAEQFANKMNEYGKQLSKFARRYPKLMHYLNEDDDLYDLGEESTEMEDMARFALNCLKWVEGDVTERRYDEIGFSPATQLKDGEVIVYSDIDKLLPNVRLSVIMRASSAEFIVETPETGKTTIATVELEGGCYYAKESNIDALTDARRDMTFFFRDYAKAYLKDWKSPYLAVRNKERVLKDISDIENYRPHYTGMYCDSINVEKLSDEEIILVNTADEDLKSMKLVCKLKDDVIELYDKNKLLNKFEGMDVHKAIFEYERIMKIKGFSYLRHDCPFR